MTSSSGTTILRGAVLLAVVLSHLQVLVSSFPLPTESNSPNNNNNLTQANITSTASRRRRSTSSVKDILTSPCGDEESADHSGDNHIVGGQSCSNQRVLCSQLHHSIKQLNESFPTAMDHCIGISLPVLDSTKVQLEDCKTDDEKVHKALVSLHLVAHFLKVLSTNHVETQKYTSFYNNMSEYLRESSCSLVCHKRGMSENDLSTFVDHLLNKQDGSATFQRNVDVTDFNSYQCIFLHRAHEAISNVLKYYANSCSLAD